MLLRQVRNALAKAISGLPWCNTYHAYEDEFFGHKTKRLHGLLQHGAELAYLGNVIHSDGGNVTDEVRMGLYFGYIPSWLQPLENPAQTHPAATLARLQPATRELLGLSEEGFVADV